MIADETIGVFRKNTSLGSIDVVIVAVLGGGGGGERERGRRQAAILFKKKELQKRTRKS